jgi:hypothetical protein
MQSLLLNWVFYEPVGHLVEALQHAHGYHCANADRFELHLMLNAATPVELAEALPWVKRVHAVAPAELATLGAAAPCLAGVPRRFDRVIADPRTRPGAFVENWDEEELVHAQALLHELYPADEYSKGWGDFYGLPEPPSSGLPYRRDARLTLPLPEEALHFAARYAVDGPKICVLLAGGGGRLRSPTRDAWIAIGRALEDALPGVRFYFTGVSERVAGRSFTRDWPPHEVEPLCRALRRAEVAYDIGLWNQLALISHCDLFLSPHTGFGFLPQLVGTPWLAVSSCPWPEYVLNGVPFYSALPDCDSYPSETRTERGCGERLRAGMRPACMEDRSIDARLDDIRRGAALLLDPGFDFAAARRLHGRKLRALEQRTGVHVPLSRAPD